MPASVNRICPHHIRRHTAPECEAIADRAEIEALRGEYRYQRTGDGWKFTERVYQIRYPGTSPLAGSAPTAEQENM